MVILRKGEEKEILDAHPWLLPSLLTDGEIVPVLPAWTSSSVPLVSERHLRKIPFSSLSRLASDGEREVRQRKKRRAPLFRPPHTTNTSTTSPRKKNEEEEKVISSRAAH